MMHLTIGVGMVLLSILFRLATKLRLTVPLLYALIAPTVFHGWFYANHTLATAIGYSLIGLAVLS